MRTLLVAFSRLTERFVLWCGLGLTTLCLVVSACQEAPPTAAEPPPPEPPRSWTPPQRIDAAPYADPSPVYPISLSTSGTSQLHLLLRVPGDTLNPPQELSMGYLFYDGAAWSLRGQLEGEGWFMPSASAANPDGRVHLFWGGILPEERQDWLARNIFSTQLFHCLWTDRTCSSPMPLMTVPPPYTNLSFDEAVQDDQGQIHVMVTASGSTMITLDANGALISTEEFFVKHPRLLPRGEKLHFVYMAAPRVLNTSNDLYYRFRQDGVWSEPVVTFHDVVKKGHYPALAIDDNEVYHLVFYEEAGSSSLMYTQSEDQGRTWALPEEIHINDQPFIFFRAPKLVVDRHGILHVVWSHTGKRLPDSSPGAASFYATRREGTWSEAEELFPDYDLKAPALLTLDASDIAHVVFLALEGEVYRLYHTRFE